MGTPSLRHHASLLCPLTSLLVVVVVFPELRHQDELWSTPRAVPPRLLMKFLTVTLAAMLAAMVGVLFALPFRHPLESFSWSGGEYLIVYLLLAALVLSLWISVGFWAAYLSRSRLLTLAVPALLWVSLGVGLLLTAVLFQDRSEGLA